MFYTILPLHEILSLHYKVGMASKKIWAIYNPLIEKFQNEFNILLNITEDELRKEKIDEKLIDLILRNRKGKIKVKPGYDGKYGVAQLEEQKKLF
jgi:PHP family Zn ribbon phosphoesterase